MINDFLNLIEQPIVWLSHVAKREQMPTRKCVSQALAHDLDTGEAIGFEASDFARHTYILGATGCGKTSLIVQLLERDVCKEHTVCVVDLRGDLVTAILGLLKRLAIDPDRVSLLDLREQKRIQGFNPLRGAGEPFIRALHLLDVVAQEAESWGVQLEESLRSALLVLSYAGRTLPEIEQLFFDDRFRAECLTHCPDDGLIGFWNRYSAMSGEKQQTWALAVLNKVTSLLAVPSLRTMLGSSSSLDLGRLLGQKGRIILVSLAVDELHRSSRMLGSLFVSCLSREMMARVNVPESHRNPVRLYVDEFENFGSESFEGLIAEGRRFGLSLVLSHQTLAQIPPRLRSVIRNNVGLQILFQCGYEDSRQLKHELSEDCSISDLRCLTVGQAVVMKRDGTCQVAQFSRPKVSPSPADIATYRNEVLDRVASSESRQTRSTRVPPKRPRTVKRTVNIEDLL